MSAATLFVHRRERVSLGEAVKAFSAVAPEAVALLYSPRSCGFAALSSGSLRDSEGRAVELSVVFEARVFCPKAELRWLNDPGPNARHRAIVVAEEALSGGLAESWDKTEIPVIETLDQTYLLWGKGTGNAMPAGWSQLGAARIGALPVPIANVNRGQPVLLATREYFQGEPEHGNVFVREERLCGLERGEVNRG